MGVVSPDPACQVRGDLIFWQIQHPPHYAIVQVQPVLEQPVVAGEKPPVPVGDPSQPVVSVIMEPLVSKRSHDYCATAPT